MQPHMLRYHCLSYGPVPTGVPTLASTATLTLTHCSVLCIAHITAGSITGQTLTAEARTQCHHTHPAGRSATGSGSLSGHATGTHVQLGSTVLVGPAHTAWWTRPARSWEIAWLPHAYTATVVFSAVAVAPPWLSGIAASSSAVGRLTHWTSADDPQLPHAAIYAPISRARSPGATSPVRRPGKSSMPARRYDSSTNCEQIMWPLSATKCSRCLLRKMRASPMAR